MTKERNGVFIMGLITKEVEVGLGGRNIKHFENLGYEIPRSIGTKGKLIVKRGTKITVKVEDLPDGSGVFVNVECDGCTKKLTRMMWKDYLTGLHDNGKIYCKSCANKLFGIDKRNIINLAKSKSFKQWCYDNLSKDNADKIILRWSKVLNVDKDGNEISPDDVSYGSLGIDGKGYWFNCLDNLEHIPEQRHITSMTTGRYNCDLSCNQCNTVYETHPHLIKYLVNKEDAKKYSYGSDVKIPMKCPDCGHEKDVAMSILSSQGFGCNKCSDGVSYPEKFLFSVFEQLLDKDFQAQLTKSTFEWCNSYRYDLYTNKINGICEVHGKQHYEESNSNWKSLEETQENDFNKEWLARSNNIKNYIIINCRYSDLDWIKKSVMESKLPKLLNFKEEDIDWLKCHEYSCKSFVKKACDLWNSGIKNATEIAEKLNIERRAIIRYLKQGDKLDWCIYPKKIICLNTREVFSSQSEAKIKYGIKDSGISMCCSDKQKSAGKDSKTDDPLRWMFYDEYLIKNQTIGWYNDYMSTHSYNGKIICLTTGEIFNTQVEAGEIYHINRRKISMCCNNKIQFVGRHPITEEPLRWMFYNEYINTIDTREEVTTIGRDTNSIAHIL